MLRYVLAISLAPLLVYHSVAQEPGPEEPMDFEKTSYSVGVRFGEFLKPAKDDIVFEALIRGLRDAMSGEDVKMEESEVARLYAAFGQALANKRSGAVRSEGRAFLEANALKEGVVRLDSGLQYKILRAGNGSSPTRSDKVEVHYRGTLLDGSVFDSTYERNEPISFAVTGVIPGWTEALLLMKEGAKWELYIPSDLAYAARGAGNAVPPHATLVFDVELIEVIRP